MNRTSRNWMIFAGVLVAGLVVAMVLDFAVRNPVQAFGLLLLAASLTGRSMPFSYTEDALSTIGHPVASSLSRVWVPLAIVAGWLCAFHQLVRGPGFGAALTVLVGMYVADRVVAWTIRHERRRWKARRAARSGPVVVDGSCASG